MPSVHSELEDTVGEERALLVVWLLLREKEIDVRGGLWVLVGDESAEEQEIGIAPVAIVHEELLTLLRVLDGRADARLLLHVKLARDRARRHVIRQVPEGNERAADARSRGIERNVVLARVNDARGPAEERKRQRERARIRLTMRLSMPESETYK